MTVPIRVVVLLVAVAVVSLGLAETEKSACEKSILLLTWTGDDRIADVKLLSTSPGNQSSLLQSRCQAQESDLFSYSYNVSTREFTFSSLFNSSKRLSVDENGRLIVQTANTTVFKICQSHKANPSSNTDYLSLYAKRQTNETTVPDYFLVKPGGLRGFRGNHPRLIPQCCSNISAPECGAFSRRVLSKTERLPYQIMMVRALSHSYLLGKPVRDACGLSSLHWPWELCKCAGAEKSKSD